MIRLRVFNAHPTYRTRAKEVATIGRALLRSEGIPDADCNIVFIGDRRMVALNSRYLRHRSATDVLSFSLGERPGELVGEVYVNLDQARRQAKTYRVTYRSEIARLAVHGLLHLAGHDDRTRSEKEAMRRRENAYLERAGIGISARGTDTVHRAV
jgi:rRNA maturation RNase YbeY